MDEMKLGYAAHVMKRRLVTATPYETVAAAADRMAENGLGCLLIVDNDRLVGVFSERDLLHRVVSRRKDPDTTPLSKVLTPNPTAVTEDMSIVHCIRLIRERGFRHLPVVNVYRHPLGIISSRDLLQHVLEVVEAEHERGGDLQGILGPRVGGSAP